MTQENVNIISELKRIKGLKFLCETEENLEKNINSLKKAVNKGDEKLIKVLKEKVSKDISKILKEEEIYSSQLKTDIGLKSFLDKRKNKYLEDSINEDNITSAINFLNNSIRTIEYESSKDNPKILDIKHIEYQGILISEESKQLIKEKLSEIGIKIQNKEPDVPHITCQYFNPVDDKESLLFSEEDIEKTIILKIIAYGEYKKDNILANQGILIDKSSLNIPLTDRNLSNTIKTEKPHITLSVNNEKKEIMNKKGKMIKVPFSTAKETVNSDFNIPIEFEIIGTLAYFSHLGVHTKIEEHEKDKKIIEINEKEAINYLNTNVEKSKNTCTASEKSLDL